MAVTPVMTIALETLALNLLLRVVGPQDRALGITYRRVSSLRRRFCSECLLTANADGWVMPRASVKAWLMSNTRRQQRSRH